MTDRSDRGPALYFDAACPLCTRAAWFIDRRDRRRSLRLLSLQGAEGDALRREHPEVAAVDSLVWVDDGSEGRRTVLTHSAAVIAVGRYLGRGWRVLADIAWCVPRPLRDGVYRFIARHRHRLGGLRHAP